MPGRHSVSESSLGPLPALLERPGDAAVVRVPAETGDEVWLISDYRLARSVLTDRRFSRTAAAQPDAPRVNTVNPAPGSMMSMDGTEHARLRRHVAAAFAPRRIAALAPDVQRLVDEYLDELIAGGSPADLIAGFAAPLPVAVIGALLGIPVEDRTRVQEWAGVLFDLTISTPREKMQRAYALFRYMSRLVDQRRADPADGLLGSLIAAHEDGALSRTEVVDLALAVLTAGYETTVGQLGLSVLCVLLEPGYRAELREPDAAAAVVEEFLRRTPATPMTFPRVALQDVDLGGVTVRAGEAIVVSLLHSNLEPAPQAAAVTPNAAAVASKSGPAPHLTFGHGAHFCLGAGLARLQLNLALTTLVRRLPNLRLADDPGAVEWCAGQATRGLARLRVSW
jgi:cytochrome P450